MIAAVNHGGDSDSTGAVTGNILGAAIGYDAIPQFFKDDLELHDVILHMAYDLHGGDVTNIKTKNRGAGGSPRTIPRAPLFGCLSLFSTISIHYAGSSLSVFLKNAWPIQILFVT